MVRFSGLAVSNTKMAVALGLIAVLFIGVLAVAHQTGASPTAGRHQSITSIPVTGQINSSAEPSSDSDEGSINNQGTLSGSSQSSVTVNGQSIPVPQNGSTSQTITNGDTTTTVNVQSQNSSTAGQSSNSNHSSLNVDVDSHSSSQKDSL